MVVRCPAIVDEMNLRFRLGDGFLDPGKAEANSHSGSKDLGDPLIS